MYQGRQLITYSFFRKKKGLYSSILLSVSVAIILFGVYSLDFLKIFSLPIKDIYAPGDGRLTIAVFKMIVAEEWSSLIVPFTPYLNAPFNFEIYDFPLPFFSEFLYIKFLSIFSSDSVVVFNLYYISTYFLNALTMYWVLRRLRVNVYLAISGAILFTFLPFHYWRLPHTFYSGYFFIPLWIYYLLLLTNKKPLFFKKKINESKYKFDWSKRNIIIILVLLISSTWNFYYTFFFALLIGFTLISNFIYKNSKYHILSTLIFLSLSVAPFMANMAPYKAYEIENGKNFQVGQRQVYEVEKRGVKIASLIFPVKDHRSEVLANFRKGYFDKEGWLYFGMLISFSFLFLIFVVFFQKKFSTTISALSKLNLFSLLMSITGGFAVIFAYIVTPQIRAYSRISIIIATISLIALMLFITWLVRNFKQSKVLIFIISLFIVAFGLWDTTSKIMTFGGNTNLEGEYLSDKNFIQKIESKFDTSEQKILIAQYPYLNFPESPGIHKMGNYEQFQGYIHSDKLHWSFGAIRGREADSWWKDLEKRSIKEQIRILQEVNFSGIMINRNGYKDNAKSMEVKLIHLLGLKPMVSENKTLSFFKLKPLGGKVLMPEILFNSFYHWEGLPGKFRWAGDGANIVLHNNKDKEEVRNISFVLGTLKDRGMTVRLNSQVLEKFEIRSGLSVERAYSLKLKPGKNTLKFETEEASVSPGGADNRRLLFSFGGFVYGRDK